MYAGERTFEVRRCASCVGPVPTTAQISPFRPVNPEGVAKSSERFPIWSAEQSLRAMHSVHFASICRTRSFFGAPSPSH